MFQDSNKEYTGSGAGVAGGNTATPVSLSAVQEVAAQAAAAAAFKQLQRQQQIADVTTTQAQLYQIVREMVQTKQQSVDPRVVLDQWQKSVQAAQGIHGTANPMPQQAEPSSVNTSVENYTSEPSEAGLKSESSSVKTTPVRSVAEEASGAGERSAEPSEELVDEEGVEDKPADATPVGAEQLRSEPQAETADLNESSAPNSEQVDDGLRQSSAPQASASNPLEGTQPDGMGDVPRSDAAQAEQGATPPPRAAPDEQATAAEKGPSGEASAPNQTADTSSSIQESGSEDPTAGSEIPTTPQAPTASADHQSPGDGKEGEKGPSSPGARAGEVNQLHAESGDPRYKKEGLPTGVRDRFKRGFEDRKSGQGFKDAYSARKLPPGGSAVKGVGEGAAKGAAESLAKEGAKDVVATAAKTAAKEGVKDTAKLASKTTPVGLLTDIDAKGAYKAAKDLKNFKVVSAAKGVTQSAAVTLFRVSYDPWVIGFTVGLSLIVTLIVGSVIFLMPSSSMTFLERLLVVALWLLLGFTMVLVLGLLLVGFCNGPQGWAIWGASFFSKTAADINKFCEPIGALQAATKNIAR